MENGIPTHFHKTDRIEEKDLIPNGEVLTALPVSGQEGQRAVINNAGTYEFYQFLQGDWRQVTGSSISLPLDATDIGAGTVDNTEFSYLNGVSSNIQTQLAGKASSSHTHSAADITSGTLDQDRLGSGSSGAGTKFLADDQTYKSITADAADIQIFTSSGTWTKPDGVSTVEVHLIGGGGGGGSGRKGAPGNKGGGGGGGGGGYSKHEFPAAVLGATETVTVGSGGVGGASQATNSTNGNNGTAGGDTSFGSWLIAKGGGAGNAGTSTNSGSAAGGEGATENGSAGTGGTFSATPATPSSTKFSGSGGGGAGGHEEGGAGAQNGAPGGGKSSTVHALSAGSAGAASASGGGNGESADSNEILGGAGGGGGGGGDATGYPGGDGGLYGGGGGGGGSGSNSGLGSGAGGEGRDGIAVIISY